MAKEAFIDKLYSKLSHLKCSVVNEKFKDNSASWIKISKDGFNVEISFNGDGDTIECVSVSQDIVQIIDEKVIKNFK